MTRAFITIVFFAALIVSCNQEKKAGHSTSEENKSSKECFQYIANNDTVMLSLEIVNNSVTGSLSYNLYEKDKSVGTIAGEMKGDTLIADYTFFAEGVTSISEVVFLKRNNQLIQGFGEITTSNEKQVFKNRSTLDFSDSLVLTAIDCEKK